ncbi:MAG: HAD family hydrolase [Victivallaceae bacterium]|nr:HAD family hydrolase [Victivallaceae bacterium]
MSRRALFLDRDGVVIKQIAYLKDAALAELEKGVADGIKRIHEAGHLAVVITNQSGIARGMFTMEDVERIHDKIQKMLLETNGERIDAFYICPHHPSFDLDCDCRKPKPGLILQAARELDIDISKSTMCGDKFDDLLCGRNAGCMESVMVRTGYGEKESPKAVEAGFPVVDGFRELVDRFLAE